MTEQEMFPLAAAPEHRPPTSTKRERSEFVMCIDCGRSWESVTAVEDLFRHKAESEGRCK